MAVNSNRPYERHMVSNIPNLLPAGLRLSDLAVGQIGIFDAKTNLSVTAPTYAVNKAIYIAQGTPDRSNFPEGAGVPNIYRKTHLIQGKKLLGLRAKKANRATTEIVTLGFDGSDTTKTLTAKPGETFYYWVRLTGDPIFNLNPDGNKGVIIQGAVQMPCADECSDNCGTVSCEIIVDKLIADWDTKLLPGGQNVTKYVKATKVTNCDAGLVSTCYHYCVTDVVDNGSSYDLGVVQQAVTANDPGLTVVRLNRNGLVSTYGVLVGPEADCPSDITLPSIVVPADCGACNVGTLTAATEVFQVKFADPAPTTGQINTAVTAYGAVTTLVQNDPDSGVSVFKVVVDEGTTLAQVEAALAADANTDDYLLVSYVGQTAATCTIDGATYSFTAQAEDACCKYQGTYKITLKDKDCEGGSDSASSTWADEITADYIDSGFATNLVVGNVGANCTREYTMDVISNCNGIGCTADEVTFPAVPSFNGIDWTFVELVAVDPETTGCVCGIQFESVYVPRVTRECTFDYFAYQTDFVHIEVSSHNPDWRSTDLCETDPAATRIRNGSYPNGAGQAVARLEKADRMYDMDYFYLAPHLREAFDFYFETNLEGYYDMVAVEYDFQYSSFNGFGQTDTDRYIQYFWLPEGQTAELVNALNTYAASVNINIDPITL